MKQITKRTGQSTASEKAQGALTSERSKKVQAFVGEKREAVFVGAVLGMVLVSGLMYLFDMTVPLQQEILLVGVLFGTIEVPRLETLSAPSRIIMMLGLSGSTLLLINMIAPGMLQSVSMATLGLLIVATAIKASAERAQYGTFGATLKRNGWYVGTAVFWVIGSFLI